MRKKVRHDTFMKCPDPSIAEHLKQGDVVRVERTLKGEVIEIDFIVQYYQMEDSYNGNFMVRAFTQQVNKLIGKPKSYVLEETLVLNKDNMDKFRFCSLGYKRWNMSRAKYTKPSVN